MSASTALPLVSILIPSYKPQYFEIALTSALAQTYPHTEILVSDDCPTEDIAQICARYPRVVYSRNPRRGGLHNLPRLLALSRGVYIKYLFDDDFLHPLCVAQMVAGFATARTATLAFSARDVVDADSRIIQRPRYFSAKGTVGAIKGEQIYRRCIIDAVNYVGEFSTVMFRKSDVQGTDGEAIFFAFHGAPILGLGDIGTWLQLCERGDALYFSEPLSYFRVHSGSNTSMVHSATYRAGVTDWLAFAKHACSNPSFSHADRLAALRNVRAHLEKRLALIPDLVVELREVDDLLQTLPQS